MLTVFRVTVQEGRGCKKETMEPSASLPPRRDHRISREENGNVNSPRTQEFSGGMILKLSRIRRWFWLTGRKAEDTEGIEVCCSNCGAES